MSITDTATESSVSLRTYFLKRIVVVFFALLVAMTLVFLFIHFGPNPPGEATTTASQAALEQKKRAFGLLRPLWVQYLDYLRDMLTFEFGQSWSDRYGLSSGVRVDPITDVNALVAKRLARTAWLWLWALVLALGIGLPVGLGLGLRGTTRDRTTASVSGALVRAVPVFLVAILLIHWTLRLQIVFGFSWYTFGVDIPTLSGPIQMRNLTNPHGFLVAVKRVLLPALAVASALVGPMVRVGQRAMQETMDAGIVEGARARGVPTSLLVGKHVLRNAVVPFVLTLRATVAILIGGAIIVEAEHMFTLEGLGTLFWKAVGFGDYTSLQATMFVFFLLLAGATLLQDVLYMRLTSSRLDRTWRANALWTAPRDSNADAPHRADSEPRTLRSLRHNATADFRARLRANPRPAVLWLLGGFILFAVEAGAVVNFIGALPGIPAIPVEIPTLLSREVIPNKGYWTPTGGWTGTFLGLEPAHAWLLRVGAVYLYAVAWLAWGWVGYRLYRSRYREADTTTTDAIFGRLRGHRWGQFGFVVVFTFVVMAVFAPTLGPTTFDRVRAPTTLQHLNPTFLQGTVTYFDAETGEVTTTSLGSVILSAEEAGRWSYDTYGRFHPLGTVDGTDRLTELLFGARVYLLVAVIAMVVAITIALVFGVLSGYYRGRIDGGISVLSDTIELLPVLPVILMLTVAFSETWIIDPAVHLVFTAVVFALLVWPALWRTIRATTLRAGESDWTDAARGFGQASSTLVSRRFAPRLVGHLLVYGLLVQGGAIIVIAVLDYWAGIPTTPMGWASFIDLGQSPPASTVALIVVITGFTALADGLRDALDPDHETGTSAPGETIGTGGGG